jgi:hypothetical protein
MLSEWLGSLLAWGVSDLAPSFEDRLDAESPARETAGTDKTAVQTRRSSRFRISLNPYPDRSVEGWLFDARPWRSSARTSK